MAKPEDYVHDPERHHRKHGGTKRVYRYGFVKLGGRVLKKAKALGVKRIKLKEMRHSFACNCLLKGYGVEKIARWLGHKDPRMVRQHYAHLLDYDDDTGLKFLDDGVRQQKPDLLALRARNFTSGLCVIPDRIWGSKWGSSGFSAAVSTTPENKYPRLSPGVFIGDLDGT